MELMFNNPDSTFSKTISNLIFSANNPFQTYQHLVTDKEYEIVH